MNSGPRGGIMKLLLGSIALVALVALVALSAGSAALAADMPVKAPVYKAPPGTVIYASGLYLSADGSWQQVRLPTYALGFRNIGAAPDLVD